MNVYDTIIIGGGPAACAAAVYAARKRMRSILITESFGGQSTLSDNIQNWIGDPHLSGADLAKNLETHVRSYHDILDIKMPEKVVSIKNINCTDGRICDFEVKTDQGVYQGKTIILASGAKRRRLGIPGEDKFEGKGVSYCSTCDAPLFAGKKVVVVGGGNAGLEAAQDLLPYAEEIYLMEHGNAIKGDSSTLEEIKKSPKLKEIILNTQTIEIAGETLVSAIKYKDLINSQEKVLAVDGVFVEIGSIPNSEIIKDLVQTDQYGQVIINFQHATTSHPGIFAAGDVTNDPYKQNFISAGDGVRAILAAYSYLLKKEKASPAAETIPHQYSSPVVFQEPVQQQDLA